MKGLVEFRVGEVFKRKTFVRAVSLVVDRCDAKFCNFGEDVTGGDTVTSKLKVVESLYGVVKDVLVVNELITGSVNFVVSGVHFRDGRSIFDA